MEAFIKALSVCPSVSPSKTSFNRPILKILFLLERYDIRDLSFIIFVCPSVRPYGWTDKIGSLSYSVLTVKILFCLKVYDTRYLCFILCVRLTLCFFVGLSFDGVFRLLTIITVTILKISIRYIFNIFARLPVHTIRISLSIKVPGKFQ